jgi:hypothetical protein
MLASLQPRCRWELRRMRSIRLDAASGRLPDSGNPGAWTAAPQQWDYLVVAEAGFATTGFHMGFGWSCPGPQGSALAGACSNPANWS